MKKLMLLIAALAVSVGSFAATPLGSGGQPGAFLSWGAGARSLGMGRAYVSVAEDATAALWNPGGLALVDQKEVTALHAILWAETNYDFLAYCQPTTDSGTFAAFAMFLNSGGFDQTDINNVSTGTFTDSQMAIGVSYGSSLISSLAISLGGSIKYYSHSLGSDSTNNLILDFGLISKPMDRLNLGLSIQNLLAFNMGGITSDVLPILARVGLSYKFLNDQLLFSGDFDSQVHWYVGSEYKLFNPDQNKPFQIAIRMGVNFEEFTVGFGAQYQEYGLDYAFSTHELGGSHRISASARFGESMVLARLEKAKAEELAKKEEANGHFKRGEEDYKSGKYASAQEKVDACLKLDPTRSDALALAKKLKTVSTIVPIESGETRESELVRKGVGYYVEGDSQSAVDVISYVMYLQPDNEKLKRLYKAILEEMGVSVPATPSYGMDIIKDKLLKALGAFYENKFQEVIKLCDEVLRLEPNNSTALERLGSAFYKVGQKKEAKQVWEKAYMLNPDNKMLKKFIDKLEKELQAPNNEVK